ncbi:MAG: NADP-dependent oxidoreductase [Stellaceae bacterium]
MKAIRIHGFGGPEVVELDDAPVPQPRENELLIRVHAASVNPVDYKIRNGTVPWVTREMLPITLGRDLSGTVESAGAGVNTFRQGGAIYAMLGGIDRGSYAEYVVVKPNEAAPKPARLSYIEAVAVPLGALTAWQGLFDHGHLQAGQTVLIQGGSGGCRSFRDPVREGQGRHGIDHGVRPKPRLCPRTRRRPGYRLPVSEVRGNRA